jgi:transcriptional regulator with XRE-family HTH domain
MMAIARTLVTKKSPLIGPEIRFLRKRLGQRSADFAQMIGVSLEQFSRWENDRNPPRESADRLIRVVYSLLSKDKKLRGLVEDKLQQWITSIHGDSFSERIVAYRIKSQWRVEAQTYAA